MVNVGNNFGRQENCKLCNKKSDSQEHLIQCSKLKQEVREVRKNKDVKPNDIYSGSMQRKIAAVKLFQKAIRKRKEILSKQEL